MLLDTQYRSAPEISAFPSARFYAGARAGRQPEHTVRVRRTRPTLQRGTRRCNVERALATWESRCNVERAVAMWEKGAARRRATCCTA